MSGDLSPTKASSSDEPFRRLAKNDIYQTVEQWRERTIMRLGEVSGQWATSATCEAQFRGCHDTSEEPTASPQTP